MDIAANLGWQPIDSAPKDRLIMLWIPEFPGFPAGPWFGMYDGAHGWQVRMPAIVDGKQLCVKGLPRPTHWQPKPEAP